MKKRLLTIAMLLWACCASAQFVWLGAATNPSPGVYNLTDLGTTCITSAGAIWSTAPAGIDFNRCFSLSFDAQFTAQIVGADGFCVVFGNNITTTTPPNNTDAALGYYDRCGGPINPAYQHSIGVEFDIFDNSWGLCTGDLRYYDHTQISLNADYSATVGGPAVPIIPSVRSIKDGLFHHYIISWNCSSQIMYVFVDGVLRKWGIIPAGTLTSLSGVHWGFTAGTGAFCSDQVIQNIVLAQSPCVTIAPISGPTTVCAGSSITLTDATPGGSWTSSGTGGSIGLTTGVITTGTSSGTMTITYSLPGSSPCGKAYYSVTVIAPSLITGPATLCEGESATFTLAPDPILPGTWGVSDPTIISAWIETYNSIHFTALTAGTEVLSYTMPGGCGVATFTLTILPAPVVAPITGGVFTCTGSTLALTDATPGGAWSITWPSTWPSIASISTTGVVTGISAGSVVVDYVVTDLDGCSTTVTTSVVVDSTTPPCVNETGGMGTDYYFNFSGSSSVTVYYVVTDVYGTILCPYLFSIPGGHSISMTAVNVAFMTYCTSTGSAAGVCIVGYCDAVSGCCWGQYPDPTTGLTDYGLPIHGHCCAVVNPGGGGRSSNLTGGNSQGASGNLSVFPNPGTGNFALTGLIDAGLTSGQADIEVTDLPGKNVARYQATVKDGKINTTLDMPVNIANGTYLITVKYNNQSHLVKYTLSR